MYSFMETEGATKTRVLGGRVKFLLIPLHLGGGDFCQSDSSCKYLRKSGLNTHGTYLSSSQATLHQTDYQSETGRN